jgi:hypothetical protein
MELMEQIMDIKMVSQVKPFKSFKSKRVLSKFNSISGEIVAIF